MVALDGNFYKISRKGKTVAVSPNWKTLFVELVKFSQNKPLHFNKLNNYALLKQAIQKKLENKMLSMPFPHFGWTGPAGAIIQISGMGPWKPLYE